MKNANKKFTCHRDGTVSFYNGFTWERTKHIPSHVWDGFSPEERTRANTTIHGLTAAEQKELRRERSVGIPRITIDDITSGMAIEPADSADTIFSVRLSELPALVARLNREAANQ